MNREDIIRMAREAGFNVEKGYLLRITGIDEDLERFAELVASAEREAWEHRYARLQSLMDVRETQPNKPCCLAEREACAKLAITISEEGLPEEMPEGEELTLAISQITGGVLIADAIRARGQA